MFEECGIVPKRTSDLAEARTALRDKGAVIFQAIGGTEVEAREFAHLFFEPAAKAIPQGARVFEGGEHDITRVKATNTLRTPCHTDGFAYGDLYPDFLLLSCVTASPSGGESILVDGYSIHRALAANPETAWAAKRMTTAAIDQTERGMQTAVSTIVMNNGSGRKMIRKTIEQRPVPQSEDFDLDRQMIKIWHDAIEQASLTAPTCKLASGEVLLLDNYRMLHGRMPYEDLNRMLWRVWVWTDEALGVPSLPLASDTRFANAT